MTGEEAGEGSPIARRRGGEQPLVAEVGRFRRLTRHLMLP
jgi:hypothetical protein